MESSEPHADYAIRIHDLVKRNETRTVGELIEKNKPYTLKFAVRKNSVSVDLGEKNLVQIAPILVPREQDLEDCKVFGAQNRDPLWAERDLPMPLDARIMQLVVRKKEIDWSPVPDEAHLLVRLGDDPREAVRAVADECGMHRSNVWRRDALRHLLALINGRKG